LFKKILYYVYFGGLPAINLLGEAELAPEEMRESKKQEHKRADELVCGSNE